MNTTTYSITNTAKDINPAEKDIVLLEAKKKQGFRTASIVWLIVTVFIFLRIFLEGLGSDPKSLFVSFIYLISGLFLLPFWGIFPSSHQTIQPGVPTFDSPAVTAIFCYTIIVLLGMGVSSLIIRMYKTGKQVDETVKKDNPIDPTQAESIVK